MKLAKEIALVKVLEVVYNVNQDIKWMNLKSVKVGRQLYNFIDPITLGITIDFKLWYYLLCVLLRFRNDYQESRKTFKRSYHVFRINTGICK